MWNPQREISEYLPGDATDSSQSKRVGVDEQFIKFKSSSNFQVMKKIIRSKLNNTGSSNRSSPNNLPDPPGSEPAAGKPEPQPADMLEGSGDGSSLSTTDVEHDDFQSPGDAAPAETFPPQDDGAAKRAEGGGDEAKPPESTIMCRDFIRGTCKRPGTCKYAHKCDKTQLFGVYTFCRNFQNKICTLPNCKYVHASVFEEQEFYRTGKLPPHVLAPKVLPPPPPPPGDLTPENRVDIPTSFSNPPPMLPPSLQSNSTMFPCLPSTSSEARMFPEEFPSTSRDSYEEPPHKKCKMCDTMDIRYSCLNDLLAKKREATEEWKRKTVEVENKKEKMNIILTGLLKLANTSAPSAAPTSLFNTGGDKYKIIEQLVNLNSANRLTVGSGDNSSSGLLGENFGMASVLANLLSEHQTLSADGGRRD